MEINTTDLYEAAFYLTLGAEITAIEAFSVNRKATCRLYLSGNDIAEAQAKYFQGKASVNLFEFRRAYQQVASYITDAKKELKRKQAHEEAAPVEGGRT